MTAAVASPIVLPPALAVDRERDATSAAVLSYFEGAETQADAFDHLVAICYKAIRPYFLPEQDGIGTREWIQDWLVGFLASYRRKTRAELIAAADDGEFRYIGRLCRLRLFDAIKSATARKNFVPVHVSLSKPVGRDEDGNEQTLVDRIGTARQDAPSSLAARNSFEDGLQRIVNAVRAITANRNALAKLDLLDGLRETLQATLVNVDEAETFRQFYSRVVLSVAGMRKVSLQAARAYLRKMKTTIAREMKAGNPAVRAIYLELETERPDYVASPGSHRTQLVEVLPDPAELTAGFHEANQCGWDDPEKIFSA